MDEAYSIALKKAKKMLEDEKGPLGGMGNARPVLKTLLDLGSAVAEVSPCSFFGTASSK